MALPLHDATTSPSDPDDLGGGGEEEEERLASKPLLSSPSTYPSAGTEEGVEELELDRRYAPYARRDAYGAMGRGPLGAAGAGRLAVGAAVLFPLRLAAGVLVLVAYYLVCRVCTLFVDEVAEEGRPRLRGWRRVAVVRAGQGLSRAMLFVFGFYWIRETHRSYPNAEVSIETFPTFSVSQHVICVADLIRLLRYVLW